MTLYSNLANSVKAQIQRGRFTAGDKLPSVRQLAKEHKVSIATVQEAYRVLETEMYAQAKPKSGYFVPHNMPYENTPKMTKPPQRPMDHQSQGGLGKTTYIYIYIYILTLNNSCNVCRKSFCSFQQLSLHKFKAPA